MKPRQRQAAILEHLQKQGKCSVEDLAHYFDTTGTTIRKDLVLLENSGAVIRTYGGVVLNKDEADPPIDHKTLINTHQKALIAEAAVKIIHDGDSIILDAGSTVLQMIPLLSRFNNITVMTNSLHIVNALSEFDSEQTIDLVITDMAMPQMDGAQLAQAIRSIKPDLPIILATGYAERLEGFPVRITQLAHGLPVGGELDYLDEGTLAQALRARRPVG